MCVVEVHDKNIRVASGLLSVNELITLHEDNVACVTQMKKRFIKSDKTKHIHANYFSFTQELEKDKRIRIQYVHSNENSTNLFTKPLLTSTFRKHVNNTGIRKLQNL